MDSTASSLESILTLICTGFICLLPFAGIAGGVVFFIRRKKKTGQQPAPPAAYQQPSAPAPVGAPAPADAPAPVGAPTPADAAAPADTAAAVSAHFAPSELVLLRADAFAPAAGLLNAYKLLGSEKKVEAPALVKTMFAAAFLSLEAAGDIRLEIRKRKVTLGLREVDSLFAVPTGAFTGSWPAGSMEQRILASAAYTLEKQQNFVHQIVYAVVGEDSSYPWGYTLEQAQRWLAGRGLLAVIKEKALLGTRERLTLPPETNLAAQQADIAPIQHLLARCQQERPQVWKILNGEVNAAVKSRVEASDSDGPDIDTD